MIESERSSTLGPVARIIGPLVAPSRMPTTEYKSMTGLYGGNLNEINGNMVFVTKGITGVIDRIGDNVLRRLDFEKLESVHDLSNSLRTPPLHRRGTPREIHQNVIRLHLSEYYGFHPKGVTIKSPEVFRSGITLYDIYHAETIESDRLSSINRFQALEEAVNHIRNVHFLYGPVGDSAEDMIFQNVENGTVSNPVLNIPDVVYDNDTSLSNEEKMSVELLDFMARISVFEKTIGDTYTQQDAVRLICETYGNLEVLEIIAKYLRNGNLPLSGDELARKRPSTERIPAIDQGFFIQHPLLRQIVTIHNNGRLGIKKTDAVKVKSVIAAGCEFYIQNHRYIDIS